jgi:hypothetical protein
LPATRKALVGKCKTQDSEQSQKNISLGFCVEAIASLLPKRKAHATRTADRPSYPHPQSSHCVHYIDIAVDISGQFS